MIQFCERARFCPSTQLENINAIASILQSEWGAGGQSCGSRPVLFLVRIIYGSSCVNTFGYSACPGYIRWRSNCLEIRILSFELLAGCGSGAIV